MRAIVKTGPWRGAELVDDHPEPVVGDHDVLIEVGAVSVCGTDREVFEWTPAAQAFRLDFPVVLGHEFAGTVVGVGSRVSTVRPGERVACETHVPCGHCFLCHNGNAHNCMNMKIVAMHLDGAFAERVAMPEHVCFPLPDDLPTEIGALLEPAGVAWHAVQRCAKAVAGSTVLVTGCGPIGLLITQFATVLGAVDIIAVEPNPYRRELARKLGARVFGPDEDVIGNIRSSFAERGGVDVAFEVSAAPSALGLALEGVRAEGTVVTIGHPAHPIAIDIAKYINKKGITLRGVFGRRIWDTWQDLARLLVSGNADVTWMISHRLPLGELGPVIRLLGAEANKVIILPQQSAA
jgi:threonine 3-dehydrogenase